MTGFIAALVLSSAVSASVPAGAELRFGDLATDGWDAIDTLAVSRDGTLAVVNGPKHVGLVYSLTDGTLQATLRGHARPIRSAASLPGRRVVTGSVDGTLRVWDLTTGATRLTLRGGHRDIVSAVVTSPDGQTIVSGGSDRRLVVWDASSGRRLRITEDQRVVRSMAISPDGQQVAASDRYQLSVRRVSDGHVVWRQTGYSCDHDKARPLTCLQGRTVWQKERPLKGGARAPRREVFRLNIYLGQVAWSADGKTVAVARDNGDVILYAAASGRPTRRLALRATSGSPKRRSYHPLVSVAMSRDGAHVAAGNKDGTVYVWKAGASLPFAKRTGHKAPVTALRYLGGGRLVSVSTDSTGIVWRRL